TSLSLLQHAPLTLRPWLFELPPWHAPRLPWPFGLPPPRRLLEVETISFFVQPAKCAAAPRAETDRQSCNHRHATSGGHSPIRRTSQLPWRSLAALRPASAPGRDSQRPRGRVHQMPFRRLRLLGAPCRAAGRSCSRRPPSLRITGALK